MARIETPSEIVEETAREMKQNLVDIIVNVHRGQTLNGVDALALLNAVGVSDDEASDLLTAAQE